MRIMSPSHPRESREDYAQHASLSPKQEVHREAYTTVHTGTQGGIHHCTHLRDTLVINLLIHTLRDTLVVNLLIYTPCVHPEVHPGRYITLLCTPWGTPWWV